MKKNMIFLTGFIVLLVFLAGCSSSSNNEDKTVQEEALDVAKAADEGRVNDIKKEVDDVMEKLPGEDAKASNSKFEGYGLSYDVNGKTFTHESAPVLGQTPVADYMTITAPNSAGIQLRMLPNEVGTYKIGEGPSQWRLVDVWFPHEGKRYTAEKGKGSGTIKITKVGTMTMGGYEGVVEGTFEGTFVAADGSEIKVTNGVFRGGG